MLYAGAVPWRSFGYNWGFAYRQPVIDYFDSPTGSRLATLRTQLRTARQLGANSLRVYLEVGQVMQSASRPRKSTLAALSKLLAAAAAERIYLDITGDLVWRPAKNPAWYDQLGEQARWQVQERFWKAVAATAAGSPAVLCYELTSEPVIGTQPGWYLGEFGGYAYVQAMAIANGRDIPTLARQWTARMAAAVRSQDRRPVTIGLLSPGEHGFSAENVGPLLDMVTLHEYPKTGDIPAAAERVRAAARTGKPVLVGETFWLNTDGAGEQQFLTAAAPYLAGGVLGFYDSRSPQRAGAASIGDALYSGALNQLRSLRPMLMRPQRAPST